MNLKFLASMFAAAAPASGDFLNEPRLNVRGYPLNAKEYSRGRDGVIRRTSPKAPSRRDNIRAGLQPKNRFA